MATSSSTSGVPGNITTASMISSMTGSSPTDVSGTASVSGSVTSSLTSSNMSQSGTNILSSGLGTPSAPSTSSTPTNSQTSNSSTSEINPTWTSTTSASNNTSTGTSSGWTSVASGSGTSISPSWTQTSSSFTFFPNSTMTIGSMTSSMATGSGTSTSAGAMTGSGSSSIPSNSPSPGSMTGTSTNSGGSDTSSIPISSSRPTSVPSSSTTSLTSNTSSGTPTPTFPSTSSLSNTTITTSTSPTNPPTSPYPSASTTCIPTAIDTGILDNGDFETGLSPWSLDLVDLFSTDYALVTTDPNSNGNAGGGANGSCTSFQVTMASNPQTAHLRENLRLRSDLVFSRPGSALRIAFYVRFSARNAARVVLSANDAQLLVVSALTYGPGGNDTTTTSTNANTSLNGRRDTGARGKKRGGMNWPGANGKGVKGAKEMKGVKEVAVGGEWTRIVVDYVAVDRLLQLSFSYQLDDALGNSIGLDQVAIFPSTVIHAPLSLPPPPPATTLMARMRSALIGR
ncbi:hypothetical protein F5Y01DRAFT_317324 [Xylaria sp. FL0043]|nr:hypothetical protein F5Y01DRAFT_317324 [Xylaria sp. FL0043]